MQGGLTELPSVSGTRLIGNIPVRNIWMLFLLASDLARFHGQYASEIEDAPDFPTLVARLLCYSVERRFRRNLSRGYRQQQARLTRVRGRIDILQTFSEDLLAKGMVACRFEEFTFDTPRNRLVRAALNALTSRLADATLRHHCARLAADFGRQGVSGVKPTRAELSGTRIGRHDHDDLLMVSLAKLVFDLVIPTEDAGSAAMTRVEKNQVLVRRLFEKAVGNFYRSLLTPRGWTVQQGKHLPWQIDFLTPDAEAFFPSMISDIILENRSANARIIIDTKFTSVLTRSQHKEAVLKSGYVYQLYSYLRSQERTHDPLSLTSKGMFLHPVVGSALEESVRIQGHEIRFVTVDLTESTSAILAHLQRLIICPEDSLL